MSGGLTPRAPHGSQESADGSQLTMLSSPEDKIALFRTLFRGRMDVYPLRFESRRTGRSGYQPACANEWVRGVCEKPRVKCFDCPSRRFLAVTDETVQWHLTGKNGRWPEYRGKSSCSGPDASKFRLHRPHPLNWQRNLPVTEKWVFNASPLILLGKAGQLDWLAGLGTVIIPSAVADEIRAGRPDDPARVFVEAPSQAERRFAECTPSGNPFGV